MHRPKRKQEPLMLLQLAETTINVPHALQGLPSGRGALAIDQPFAVVWQRRKLLPIGFYGVAGSERIDLK
jgi:hypothetical protein